MFLNAHMTQKKNSVEQRFIKKKTKNLSQVISPLNFDGA